MFSKINSPSGSILFENSSSIMDIRDSDGAVSVAVARLRRSRKRRRGKRTGKSRKKRRNKGSLSPIERLVWSPSDKASTTDEVWQIWNSTKKYLKFKLYHDQENDGDDNGNECDDEILTKATPPSTPSSGFFSLLTTPYMYLSAWSSPPAVAPYPPTKSQLKLGGGERYKRWEKTKEGECEARNHVGTASCAKENKLLNQDFEHGTWLSFSNLSNNLKLSSIITAPLLANPTNK